MASKVIDDELIDWASIDSSLGQCFEIETSTSLGHLHKSMCDSSLRFEQEACSRLCQVSSGDVTNSIFRMSKCLVPARRKWLVNDVQS